MAKAPKKATTISMKQIAAELATAHDLTKKDAEAIMAGFVGQVTKHLKKGERLRLAGFGILQVRNRPERQGRNPATGEPITIKASRKVAFRPAKELKDSV